MKRRPNRDTKRRKVMPTTRLTRDQILEALDHFSSDDLADTEKKARYLRESQCAEVVQSTLDPHEICPLLFQEFQKMHGFTVCRSSSVTL